MSDDKSTRAKDSEWEWNYIFIWILVALLTEQISPQQMNNAYISKVHFEALSYKVDHTQEPL